MAIAFMLDEINRAKKGVASRTVRQDLTALHALGVVTYTGYISNGHCEYFGGNDNTLRSPTIHPLYEILSETDRDSAHRA